MAAQQVVCRLCVFLEASVAVQFVAFCAMQCSTCFMAGVTQGKDYLASLGCLRVMTIWLLGELRSL